MLALSLLLNIVVDNDVFNVVQVEQRGVGQVGSWWKENVNLGSDALGAVPNVELKRPKYAQDHDQRVENI